MTQQYSIDTLLAQAGNRSDERTGAVSTPIYLSTAYGHHGIGESTGFDYSGYAEALKNFPGDLIIRVQKIQRVLF